MILDLLANSVPLDEGTKHSLSVRELATYPAGTRCRITHGRSNGDDYPPCVGDVVVYLRCNRICGDVVEILVQARYRSWLSYQSGYEFEVV